MNENQLALKKVSSKIGIILFFVLLITYVVQIIASYLFSMIAPSVMSQPWYVWSLTVISLYLVAFPMYLKTTKAIPNFEMSCEKKYSATEMVALVFICLTATYLCNFLSVGLNTLIGYLKGSAVINPIESAVNSSNIVYTFIVACIMAPVVEEIMFRKVIIDKLVGYGENVAVVVSSFAFALFHGNLYQILYAYVLGVIFARITIKSGTIKYSVILHIVINTIGSVIIPYFALNSSEIVAGIVGLALIVAMLVGMVIYIRKRSVLFPALKETPEIDGQEKVKVSTALLSEGMIVFWVVSIIVILISTFAS